MKLSCQPLLQEMRLPVDKKGAIQLHKETHETSDVDAHVKALHHTLGKGPTQAAPGNHDHDLHKGRLSRAAAQSVNDSTTVGVDWSATTYNYGDIVDLANDQFVIKRAGIYSIKFGLKWAAAAAGRRVGLINVNGAEVQRTTTAPNGATIWGHDAVYENLFAVGDTIDFDIRQESGAALDFTGWATIHEVL